MLWEKELEMIVQSVKVSYPALHAIALRIRPVRTGHLGVQGLPPDRNWTHLPDQIGRALCPSHKTQYHQVRGMPIQLDLDFRNSRSLVSPS